MENPVDFYSFTIGELIDTDLSFFAEIYTNQFYYIGYIPKTNVYNMNTPGLYAYGSSGDYRIYLSYARTGSASSPGAYPTTLYSWTSSVKSIKPTKVSGIKIWVGKYKEKIIQE